MTEKWCLQMKRHLPSVELSTLSSLISVMTALMEISRVRMFSTTNQLEKMLCTGLSVVNPIGIFILSELNQRIIFTLSKQAFNESLEFFNHS